MTHGQGDPSFPRLGQMIVDYETPMKKLAEDFVPHSKLIYESLQSLAGVYKQKSSTAEDMRRNLMLNLSSSPNLMLQPPFTDTINCDYLSFEQIERWIVLASPLCMGYMHHQDCLDMFKSVLLNSHVHTLYRDDTILTHDFLLKFLEISKKFAFFYLRVMCIHNHPPYPKSTKSHNLVGFKGRVGRLGFILGSVKITFFYLLKNKKENTFLKITYFKYQKSNAF